MSPLHRPFRKALVFPLIFRRRSSVLRAFPEGPHCPSPTCSSYVLAAALGQFLERRSERGSKKLLQAPRVQRPPPLPSEPLYCISSLHQINAVPCQHYRFAPYSLELIRFFLSSPPPPVKPLAVSRIFASLATPMSSVAQFRFLFMPFLATPVFWSEGHLWSMSSPLIEFAPMPPQRSAPKK